MAHPFDNYGARHIGHVTIAAPSFTPVFPSPEDFVGKNPRDHPALFARAPWGDAAYVGNDDVIGVYVTNGYLPGDIPAWGIHKNAWIMYGAIPKDYVRRRHGESVGDAFTAFTSLTYRRLERSPCLVPVPANVDVDLTFYRTEGEIAYVDRLVECTVGSSWVSFPNNVGDSSLLYDVRLRAEFRFLRKKDSPFFDRCVRWEREARKRFGFLIPYQNIEVDRVKREYMRRLYVPLPEDWTDYEVPDGFWVELPTVISYYARDFVTNPATGWWRVLYTEWVANVAMAWLWECYDTHRMWYLPSAVLSRVPMLDLSRVLGGPANQSELYRLFDFYGQVDWDNPMEVPSGNSKRRARHDFMYCHGRRHPRCGDWVWFDPVQGVFLTSEQARVLNRKSREVPRDHPRGYVYIAEDDDVMSEGEDGQEASVDGASPMDEDNNSDGLDDKTVAFLLSAGMMPTQLQQPRDSVATIIRDRFHDATVANVPAVARCAVMNFLRQVGVVKGPEVASLDPSEAFRLFLESMQARGSSAMVVGTVKGGPTDVGTSVPKGNEAPSASLEGGASVARDAPDGGDEEDPELVGPDFDYT